MERTVQVTLAVGNDIEGKLAHGEQRASIGGIDLAQIIANAQLLADRQQEYERTIRILQARLKSIMASHEELLATVQFLIEAFPRSTNPSVSRSYH
jgi:hypothetical protein